MTWPGRREPMPVLSGARDIAAQSCLHVKSAWQRSLSTHARLRQALAAAALKGVHTIYVVGSLGRMEQLAASDCDLIIVTEDDLPPPHQRTVCDSVWQALASVKIEPPRSDGIYARPVAVGELLNPAARGRVDESLASFGARMQLLLEGQPVYAEQACAQLVVDILHWYGTPGPPHARANACSAWQYLLHDLQRYYRALCMRTQWISDAARWQTVNIKLRHSRRLAYAGLLMLLAQSARLTHPAPHAEDHGPYLHAWVHWLSGQLPQTPLERVLNHPTAARTTERSGDGPMDSMDSTGHTVPAQTDKPLLVHAELVQSYDRFLELMEHGDFESATESATESAPESTVGQLWRNASLFEECLDRLIRQVMPDWSEPFRRQFLV